MTPSCLVLLDYSGSVLDRDAKAWLLTALLQSPEQNIVVAIPGWDDMTFKTLNLNNFEEVDYILNHTQGRGGDPNFPKMLINALGHPNLNTTVEHVVFCTDLFIEPFERPHVSDKVHFEFVTDIKDYNNVAVYRNLYQWVETFADLTQTIGSDEVDSVLEHHRALRQRETIEKSVVVGNQRFKSFRKI